MSRFSRLATQLAPVGQLQPQASSDWRGDFPLPQTLTDFYQQVGPNNLQLCCDDLVEIPSLARLWDYQAGYRWHSHSGEAIDGWQPNWLVIADNNADPIVFDLNTERVLFDIHGGKWQFQPLAIDLETAFGAFATMAQAIAQCDADEYWDDDNCCYTPKALDYRFTKLSKFLGSPQAASEFLSVLEW
ncbi:hypothetical protein [Celerinatantimonas sp. MCCC 1A17872]|uniref:hypothetical protein n=1 Tax=Celerinatantimonas sp. MCCC 1A17872 TaxID=3177514 RepID=UPI0038CA67C7